MKFSLYIYTLLALVTLASCTQEPEKTPLPHIVTQKATLGYVEQSNAIEATVEGKKTTSLAFKAAGRIANINVEVGTRVHKGDILATLGNEEGSIGVNGLNSTLYAMDASVQAMQTAIAHTQDSKNALATLYDARISLAEQENKRSEIGTKTAQADYALAQKLEAFGKAIANGTLQNTEQAIAQANANVALAETNLAAGIRVLSGSTTLDIDAVKRAQTNLERAQKELDNTKNSIATERESARKNGLSALTNAFLVARDARDFIDKKLGITDANAITDTAQYNLLGAKDASSKEKAKSAFFAFDTQYQTMLNWYNASIDGKPDASVETVRYGLENGLVAMDNLRRTLHAFSTVVEMSVAGSALTQAQIDAIKAETASRIASLETVILSDNGGGMKGSLAALNAVDAKETLTISTLENAVTLASNALESAKTGKSVGTDDVLRWRESLQTNVTLAKSLAEIAKTNKKLSENETAKNLATLKTNTEVKHQALKLAQISQESAKKWIETIHAEKNAKLAEADANVANVEASTAGIRANQTQVATQVALTQESIASGILVAPYDGVIVGRMAEVGLVTNAGTPVLAIAEEGERVARIAVDNTTYSLVIWSTVTAYIDGKTEWYTGTVTLVGNHLDSETHKTPIEIRLPNTLELGASVLIGISSVEKPLVAASVVIPNSAIITRYGSPGVFTVTSHGTTLFKRLEILGANSKQTAVQGIQAGETVITAGHDLLLDGDRVR